MFQTRTTDSRFRIKNCLRRQPQSNWLVQCGQRVASSAISLLQYGQIFVVGASSSELPFADVADGLGLRHVAEGVILVSILSSIAGGMRVALTVWSPRVPVPIASLLAVLASMLIAVIPFSSLVRYVYPVLGWLGVAVVSAYVLLAILTILQRRGQSVPNIHSNRGFMVINLKKKDAL